MEKLYFYARSQNYLNDCIDATELVLLPVDVEVKFAKCHNPYFTHTRVFETEPE
jgi:hypothetical protein